MILKNGAMNVKKHWLCPELIWYPVGPCPKFFLNLILDNKYSSYAQIIGITNTTRINFLECLGIKYVQIGSKSSSKSQNQHNHTKIYFRKWHNIMN